MYRLSFKVSGERLGDALNRLHKFVSEISVIPLKAVSSQPPRVKPKNKPKSRRKRKNGPSIAEQTSQVIHSFGLQPIELKTIRQALKDRGIEERNVYGALREEMKAGRVVKLKPGLYRRTGASFEAELQKTASN